MCCSGNVSHFCHRGLSAVTNDLLGRGSFMLMGFIGGATREWWCFLLNLGVWKVLLLLHGGLPGSQGFFFCTCCRNSGLGKSQVRGAEAAGSSVGCQCSSLVGQVSILEEFALPVNAGTPVHFFLLDENTAEPRSVFTLALVPCSSDLQSPLSS